MKAVVSILAIAVGCVLTHSCTLAKNSEAEELVNVVDAYHEALVKGDREAALSLLSENVMVLESGHIETAEEYLSHHLGADMEFSKAVPGTRTVLEAVKEGKVGWVVSSNTVKGTFQNRPVNSAVAEMMVLNKEKDGWKIRAIHWSSRRVVE